MPRKIHHGRGTGIAAHACPAGSAGGDSQQRAGVQSGLICVLTCLEQCQTYSLRRRGEKKWPQLVPERRKCQFIYFYLQDPEFGFMHVRLQTWLPMTIQVCINGHECLAGQLSREGIGFKKLGNCFTQIDDVCRRPPKNCWIRSAGPWSDKDVATEPCVRWLPTTPNCSNICSREILQSKDFAIGTCTRGCIRTGTVPPKNAVGFPIESRARSACYAPTA